MERVKCVGGEEWMWVVGACLCFYSVQVFAHVHCVCVLCVYYVCCVFCVCVRARVCVYVCAPVLCVCVLCGVNVCCERGGGVWKE